jgi:hypothetical protein
VIHHWQAWQATGSLQQHATVHVYASVPASCNRLQGVAVSILPQGIWQTKKIWQTEEDTALSFHHVANPQILV